MSESFKTFGGSFKSESSLFFPNVLYQKQKLYLKTRGADTKRMLQEINQNVEVNYKLIIHNWQN